MGTVSSWNQLYWPDPKTKSEWLLSKVERFCSFGAREKLMMIDRQGGIYRAFRENEVTTPQSSTAYKVAAYATIFIPLSLVLASSFSLLPPMTLAAASIFLIPITAFVIRILAYPKYRIIPSTELKKLVLNGDQSIKIALRTLSFGKDLIPTPLSAWKAAIQTGPDALQNLWKRGFSASDVNEHRESLWVVAKKSSNWEETGAALIEAGLAPILHLFCDQFETPSFSEDDACCKAILLMSLGDNTTFTTHDIDRLCQAVVKDSILLQTLYRSNTVLGIMKKIYYHNTQETNLPQRSLNICSLYLFECNNDLALKKAFDGATWWICFCGFQSFKNLVTPLWLRHCPTSVVEELLPMTTLEESDKVELWSEALKRNNSQCIKKLLVVCPLNKLRKEQLLLPILKIFLTDPDLFETIKLALVQQALLWNLNDLELNLLLERASNTAEIYTLITTEHLKKITPFNIDRFWKGLHDKLARCYKGDTTHTFFQILLNSYSPGSITLATQFDIIQKILQLSNRPHLQQDLNHILMKTQFGEQFSPTQRFTLWSCIFDFLKVADQSDLSPTPTKELVEPMWNLRHEIPNYLKKWPLSHLNIQDLKTLVDKNALLSPPVNLNLVSDQ